MSVVFRIRECCDTFTCFVTQREFVLTWCHTSVVPVDCKTLSDFITSSLSNITSFRMSTLSLILEGTKGQVYSKSMKFRLARQPSQFFGETPHSRSVSSSLKIRFAFLIDASISASLTFSSPMPMERTGSQHLSQFRNANTVRSVLLSRPKGS